jgi:hypothetical protein
MTLQLGQLRKKVHPKRTSRPPNQRAAIPWPDPPTYPVPTIREASADQVVTATAAPTEMASTQSIQPTLHARAADKTEDNSRAVATVSVISEPIQIFLVGVFGLILAGVLFRIAMKFVGTRRGRINIAEPDSLGLDDPGEHELADQQEYMELVDQGKERIDDLIHRLQSDRNERGVGDGRQFVRQRPTLINDLPVRSGDKARRLIRNDYELQEAAQHRDQDADVKSQRLIRNDYELQEAPQQTDQDADLESRRLIRNDYELQEAPQQRDQGRLKVSAPHPK